jgi:hypothetical protein
VTSDMTCRPQRLKSPPKAKNHLAVGTIRGCSGVASGGQAWALQHWACTEADLSVVGGHQW